MSRDTKEKTILFHFNCPVYFDEHRLGFARMDDDFSNLDIVPGEYVYFRKYNVLVTWNNIQHIENLTYEQLDTMRTRLRFLKG